MSDPAPATHDPDLIIPDLLIHSTHQLVQAAISNKLTIVSTRRKSDDSPVFLLAVVVPGPDGNTIFRPYAELLDPGASETPYINPCDAARLPPEPLS